MLIKQVILGLLSGEPLTGYDLKKRFSGSLLLPWSGNSNQIYKALLELHDEGLVTVEEQQQANKPPRKVYSLAEKGHQALRDWLCSPPELPQFENPLLIQLLWADQAERSATRAVLETYEAELREHVIMLREYSRRQTDLAADHHSLVEQAMQHWVSLYEFHLAWVHQLRDTLTPPEEKP
ncbi:MAG: PadR family transcriptional regulator [Anaerolineae bacterium]